MTVKISIQELERALETIKGKSQVEKIEVRVDTRNLILSAIDNDDNLMEAILNDEQKQLAKFRYTERLAYMK